MLHFFLIFLTIQIPFVVYQIVQLRNLKKANRKARGKVLSIVKKNQKLMHAVYLKLENLTRSHSLPDALLNIPFADQAGIILHVKRVSFSSPAAPYNASIGCAENRYYLFFRYDLPTVESGVSSNIASIELDEALNPLEQTFCKIQTNSSFSEDPRFFQHGTTHFLLYNDITDDLHWRSMRIGAINLKNPQLEYITALHHTFEKIEKNWTPFSHREEIHFVYDIEQQQIVSLPDPKKNGLHIFSSSCSLSTHWSNQWGLLRGGTPAILIDGEYLSFFHSSFEDDKGILWYVMGAYTFAASTPFKVTRISPHPLLFKGIYDTPHRPMANPRVRSLYPSGLVLQQSNGQELIVVSCGENDSGIKLITLDKNTLFASLIFHRE